MRNATERSLRERSIIKQRAITIRNTQLIGQVFKEDNRKCEFERFFISGLAIEKRELDIICNMSSLAPVIEQ